MERARAPGTEEPQLKPRQSWTNKGGLICNVSSSDKLNEDYCSRRSGVYMWERALGEHEHSLWTLGLGFTVFHTKHIHENLVFITAQITDPPRN